MVKGLMGYLYSENTVVIDKSDIKNAKDEDFRQVSIYIKAKDIKEWVEELEFIDEVNKMELEEQLEMEW